MARKYKHSEVFAEVKAIEEDIKVNLTSLQYLQILDYYLWNSLYFLTRISPKFFTCFLSKVIGYQQVHAMSKLSSESRDYMTRMFFNYVTTKDDEYLKKMHLNRGIYFGILSYWVNKSKRYFYLKSPFCKEEDLSGEMHRIYHELGISDPTLYYASFKQIEYWLNKALDFKSKIMQKYVRMTLLQAQRTYVDFNHEMDLDDVTQVYLQVMSKAIDRCDSRFGVLTTFIQSWLKSARAAVQRQVESKHKCVSYEGLIEEYGDAVEMGVTLFDDSFDAVEELSRITQEVDTTGCIRILYSIPQFICESDRKLLESSCLR